jgi:hypothetical protein
VRGAARKGGPYRDRSYRGWFSKVTLPAEMQGWFWAYGLADGSTSLQVPTGPYENATLMIPEPGTPLMLLSGALGLLYVLCYGAGGSEAPTADSPFEG